MVDWRSMRIMFLLPIFLLGLVVFVLWRGVTFGPIHLAFFSQPTPSITPRVNGAVSVVMPEVNPVLHIDEPATSVFAPVGRVAGVASDSEVRQVTYLPVVAVAPPGKVVVGAHQVLYPMPSY